MPGLADELRRLAKLRRTRANYDAVVEQLNELMDQAESARTVLEALEEATNAVQALVEALDGAGDDTPLVPGADDLHTDADTFLAELPGGGDSTITENIEGLDGACSEYADAQDDRDYSGEDRDEIWGRIQDLLTQIADAISPVRPAKDKN